MRIRQNRTHPLKKAGLFSKMMMGWVDAPLKLQDKVGVWTQETHYDLPNYDQIVGSANRLFKEYRKDKSVIWAIIRTFKGLVTLSLLFTALYCLINLFSAYIASQIVSLIIANEGKLSDADFQQLGILFVCVMAMLFIASVI